MQHYAISKLRYVSSDAVCSVVHMVAYKTLKHWKTQTKPSSKKVVAVADKRWPFTRGSNFKALSGEILMFLLGGHTWTEFSVSILELLKFLCNSYLVG